MKKTAIIFLLFIVCIFSSSCGLLVDKKQLEKEKKDLALLEQGVHPVATLRSNSSDAEISEAERFCIKDAPNREVCIQQIALGIMPNYKRAITFCYDLQLKRIGAHPDVDICFSTIKPELRSQMRNLLSQCNEKYYSYGGKLPWELGACYEKYLDILLDLAPEQSFLHIKTTLEMCEAVFEYDEEGKDDCLFMAATKRVYPPESITEEEKRALEELQFTFCKKIGMQEWPSNDEIRLRADCILKTDGSHNVLVEEVREYCTIGGELEVECLIEMNRVLSASGKRTEAAGLCNEVDTSRFNDLGYQLLDECLEIAREE